jgi:uridine kinase
VKTTLIGIAGGSCSGKTTLGKKIFDYLGGADKCVLLYQDSYYIDQSHRFKEDGGDVNFDHPSSLDFYLLSKHLEQLKKGREIEVPHYDFSTHKRLDHTLKVSPKEFVLVDGTLILSQDNVSSLFHTSVFLNVPELTRFERRKNRDVVERGRTLDGVVKQFQNHVKPMHDEFVQPSMARAKLVVDNSFSLESIMARLFD